MEHNILIQTSGEFLVDGKPDIPRCDGCGKDYCGFKGCSHCKSVFYCDSECQFKHWYEGGHKENCRFLKKQTKEKGKLAVKLLKDEAALADPEIVLEFYRHLSLSAAYDVSVRHGLHSVIQDRLQSFRDGNPPHSSFHYLITSLVVLFTGHRREGQYEVVIGNCMRYVDERRVKKYIQSNLRAFDDWFDASIRILDIFYGPPNNDLEEAALTTWSLWEQVLLSFRAAKSILLWASRNQDDKSARAASLARAKSILLRLKEVIAKIGSKYDLFGTDAFSKVMNVVIQCATFICVRCEQLGITVNAVKLLGLKHNRRILQYFKTVFSPLAKLTIEKKRSLTQEEWEAALRVAITEAAAEEVARAEATARPHPATRRGRRGRK